MTNASAGWWFVLVMGSDQCVGGLRVQCVVPYVQCVAGLACPMRPGVGVQCIGVVVGVKIVQCIGTSRYRDKRKDGR